MRTTLAFIIASVFIQCSLSSAAEEEVLVASIDWPPYSIHKGQNAEGVAVDVLREIAKRKNYKLRDILIPIVRMDEIATKHAALFSTVARTPRREAQLNFIGKTSDDWYCFMTLKSAKPFLTLDDARKAKAVAVNKGGASHDFLVKENGFQNLDFNEGSAGGARKLFAGTVDGSFTTNRSWAYTVRTIGKDPKDAVCSGEFGRSQYWIAATKSLPQKVYDDFMTGFKELEKEGFLKNTWEKYQ